MITRERSNEIIKEINSGGTLARFRDPDSPGRVYAELATPHGGVRLLDSKRRELGEFTRDEANLYRFWEKHLDQVAPLPETPLHPDDVPIQRS